MRTLYLLSVWTHILAVAVWLGGMVFLVLVLVPVMRRAEYRGHASGLIHWTGQRFRWIGWVCLTLLILTGMFNLAYRGYGWAALWDGSLWRGSFGQILGLKLLLVAVILVLSAVHDFIVGPQAAALTARDPADESALRMRRAASWFGRVNLLLAVVGNAIGMGCAAKNTAKLPLDSVVWYRVYTHPT